MSSTARGASRENNDFYPTPAWAVDLFLDHYMAEHSVGTVLEPAAGDGAIIRRLIKYGWAAENIEAIELDTQRAASVRGLVPLVWCGSFFDADPPSFDLIITNPPFALASEFAGMALRLAGTAGTVALLLRLNWLGSQDRAAFHRAHPSDILLLPKRPEFTASMSCSAKKSGCTYRATLAIEAPRPKLCPLCGAKTNCSTTDSIEYAWFVWGPGRGNRWSILPMPESKP